MLPSAYKVLAIYDYRSFLVPLLTRHINMRGNQRTSKLTVSSNPLMLCKANTVGDKMTRQCPLHKYWRPFAWSCPLHFVDRSSCNQWNPCFCVVVVFFILILAHQGLSRQTQAILKGPGTRMTRLYKEKTKTWDTCI